MQPFECQKSIDRAAKLAGVKRITHHDLRQLFATRLLRLMRFGRQCGTQQDEHQHKR
jgi:integrase